MVFQVTGDLPALAEQGADLLGRGVGVLGLEGAEGDTAGVFEKSGAGEEFPGRGSSAGAQHLLNKQRVSHREVRFHPGIVTEWCGPSGGCGECLPDGLAGPEAEAFAELAGFFVGGIFGPEVEGGGEVKGGELEVHGPPAAVADVGVARGAGEGGEEEVGGAGAAEVGEGGADFGEGQVHEAVAAEDEVGGGKRVGDDVAVEEGAVGAGVALLVGGDDGGDDVDAEVMGGGEVDFAHPVEVAAGGVEEGADVEADEEGGEVLADDGGLGEFAARAGGGFGAAPAVGGIDGGERLLARLGGEGAGAPLAEEVAGEEGAFEARI